MYLTLNGKGVDVLVNWLISSKTRELSQLMSPGQESALPINYLQVTDEHFERGAKSGAPQAQNQAQQAGEG